MSFIGSISVAMTGPMTPNVSKLFARDPLVEGRVLLEQIDRGHVVHARVAEDVPACLRLAHHRAFFADDDAELALVDDAAGIGFRADDRLAGGVVRVRRLEEVERLLRHQKPFFSASW